MNTIKATKASISQIATRNSTKVTSKCDIINYKCYNGIIDLHSIVSNLEDQLLKPQYTYSLQSEEIKSVLQSLDYQTISAQLPTLLQGDGEYFLKLLEDILILVRDLNRSESKSDYILSIVTFTKLRSNKSFCNLLIDQWDRLMSCVLQSDDKENCFTKLRGFLDNYEPLKTLPIFKKFYRFLMYCMGTSIFEKMGIKFHLDYFSKVEQATIKKEFFLGPDFIHCIMDTALYLCETGYQCMVTGSLDPIFHHESAYDKWNKDAELLKTQFKYISNPEPHGFTIFDYLSRLDSTIEKGESIVKFNANSDKYAKNLARTILNELKGFRADCLTKRLAQQDRKAPFSVLIAGGSSVGKSTFTKMLYYHYGNLFKLPITSEYRFVRNPYDQYWTNFNSSQWCVQLDDIAFLHPNKSTSCDPSLAEMLQVVNNVPFVPTQADLCDKGRTPLRARFVIATTNTESLNAKDYFACPLAVQRRLPYVINITPRAEYLKDGCMLDTSKIPASNEGEYPDFWQITIKRVVPSQGINTHMGQVGELQTTNIFDNVRDFLLWFNTIAKESENTQSSSMDCDTHMSKVKLCVCGIPIKSCSVCSVALQSSEIIVYNTPWVESMHSRHGHVETDLESWSEEDKYTRNTALHYIYHCSLVHKICLLWYACIMHIMMKWTWGPCIIAFLFGRWYFFFLTCRLAHIPEMRQLAIHLMGRKAYRATIKNPKIIVFCSALTAVITIYKAFGFINSFRSKKIVDNFQVSTERGVKPEPKNDKMENVWYKDNYECTPFDFTESTRSKANWSLQDMEKALLNNVVFMRIKYRKTEYEITERRSKALCIGGRIYMLNNHSIPVEQFELDVIMQCGKDGVNTNCTYLITPGQYIRYPEKDLIFINLPVPPKKDIRELFAKVSYSGRFDGYYLGRNIDGSIYRNVLLNCTPLPDFTHAVDVAIPIKNKAWLAKPQIPTENGDCGSVMIVSSAYGPTLLGIHTIGRSDGTCIAMGVTYDFLMTLPFDILDNKMPTLKVGEYEAVLGDLNKKSPFRYIDNGTAQVFGSFQGFRGNMKSRVCKTLMSDLAVSHGYERNTAAPMMNSWIPWRKALLDMTRPVTHIDMNVLSHCMNSFLLDIFQGLTKEDYGELVVYDNMTAINGCPGLAYVDKINRNTSAGFPFKKSKKFFLTPLEGFDEYTNPVEVTPEILSEVDNIISTYESKRIYSAVFTASLKDEPLPLQKCIDGKTRVFCGASLPYTIVVRKYCLSVIRIIQKNRFLFEAGPGTIAQSTEWDDIYRHITQFGEDRIIAGDYGKFDKRMPAGVILAAFDIIINLLYMAGWKERDVLVVKGIAEDTAFPTIDFNGDLMKCYGTNPSGHPLTVIINGLANSLYIRYCYTLANPKKSCDEFKKNVALMTYGDDMIAGVNKSIEWFNHTVIKEKLADIDIEFTMADKLAPSIPFISIDDATFLRRSWRYEHELGKYVCPIEHASIDKMLTMCVLSKSISPELQAVAVMQTVVREYFWYGKMIFEDKRKLMLQFIDQLNLGVYYETPFPTWEQLIERGLCQSCASLLEMKRCVNHLDSPPTQEYICVKSECSLQSEEVTTVLNGTEATSSTNATTTEFLDETPGTLWSMPLPPRTNLMDCQPQIELAQYLSRPVLINTFTWTQTDTAGAKTTFFPWHLFFNSTPIKNKITNYAFLSCTLKLKFVINASPFYSGAIAFTYCPLQQLVGNNIVSDAAQSESMPYSQRPKCWVFPQTCQGGELELPFFYHKNWVNATSAADVKSLGTITPYIYAPLVSANGVTGTSVLVNIYAWAENIKLHAPTVSTALQSSEFDYKPSQIASSVAAASKTLSRIPMIGPYMKATSAVAMGVSKIASSLGFTNVPNIDTVDMFKPSPFPQNSSCEISVPIERSGVDPKNEVTLDPRTVGLDGTDELAITNIACRESYIGSAILSSSDAVDALTLVSRVTPALIYQLNANSPINYTPMGYLCEMFKMWRGDIIFRFKFICTRFHKGRVRITWDPTGDISTTVPDYTTVFNEVVDIGAEQDIEVRVPYSQATTFLTTSLAPGYYNLNGGVVAPSPTSCNGLITMRVVNPLSGPVANVAIPVLVFARAAENIEYAWPSIGRSATTTLSPYTLQSAELTYPVNVKQVVAGNSTTDGDPNRNLVHFGESVKSLRPLIHRLAWQYVLQPNLASTDTASIYSVLSGRRLMYPGFISNGISLANQVIGVGTARYNFVKCNIHQLVSLLFIGQRGSINFSYNIESSVTTPSSNVTLKRYDDIIAGFLSSGQTTSTSRDVIYQLYNTRLSEYNNGTALTDQRNQPAIAMNFPYYSQYNFQLVNPSSANFGSAVDGSNVDNVVLQISTQPVGSSYAVRANVWAGYGPDYNFFFFINTPSLYAYTIPTGV